MEEQGISLEELEPKWGLHLRPHIGSTTGTKLAMEAQFATWPIRWAGAILNKYTGGQDGETSWKRRRGA